MPRLLLDPRIQRSSKQEHLIREYAWAGLRFSHASVGFRLRMVNWNCGRVAQLVEQRPFKAWVAGSNPAALTTTYLAHALAVRPLVIASC
jgi:hypothetical protein